MQKTATNKRKISVKTAAKECFNIVKNINPKLLSAVVSIVMLLSSFGIITKYYTVGYSVYYGDVNVGVISSKAEALKAYDEASSDVAEYNGGNLVHDLSFVMTIAPVSEVAESNIYHSIVEAAEGKEPCYKITANGTKIASVKTKNEAEEAVRLYVSRYNRDDAMVYTSYAISPSTDIVTEIVDVYEAARLIGESGLFTVVYKDILEEEVVIEYKEIVVENENLPEGTTVCRQEGVDGVGTRREIVFYEDGVKKHNIDPVVIVLTPAVDRVVHIGTGKMVGLEKNSLSWPAEGEFTSEYGRRWGRNHNGIDIAAKTGTPIYAPCMGKVTFAGKRNGYGNYVTIDHGNGYVTTYAHMNSINVTEGQVVALGDKIGAIGTTGRVTGAHLHFEILLNGNYVDPMDYIAG